MLEYKYIERGPIVKVSLKILQNLFSPETKFRWQSGT